ncbi:hypothetical protein QR680_017320 [Steinernema hermaphroditum]|uniref:Major facilitator superfamily (MFS) profile domain-containing protein n=1 Tax=Steinernema hermaphroditum TaxID=289476 RepID=A0AA39HE45_9BILA|nr:hypothetical protein QR680_017320 [Steinernema hermaphroditum]
MNQLKSALLGGSRYRASAGFDEETPLLATSSSSMPVLTSDAQRPSSSNLIQCTAAARYSLFSELNMLLSSHSLPNVDEETRDAVSDKLTHRRSIHWPIIASPFMPFGTQTSCEPTERQSTNSPSTPLARRYGTAPEKPTIGEQDSNNEDESEEESSFSSSGSSSETRTGGFSSLSKREWATIVMLAFANLCSTIAFGCIAPFYPGEAQLKGLNSSQIGIVFGAFELVMFICAPLLGRYMAFFGSKRMFVAGLIITGITAMAFGGMNLMPPGMPFFFTSLALRCVEAVGDAAFVTSSFAISAKAFPGRIATIVGIMETFAGLGYMLGPVVGGVLYEYGGFQLPFFVLGGVLILAGTVSCYLVEEYIDEPGEDTKGMMGMLKIPHIWIMVYAVVICAISLSFLDPTLSPHLASFNLSPSMIGLLFLLCGGVYTVTAPFWGLLIDRYRCTNFLMLFGAVATVISMFLIGPTPLLGMTKDLFWIGVGLALLGLAAGALYIPTFQNCLDAVRAKGYEDNFQTYGCVSGVFQSAFAFGGFIGPTLGGMGVEWIGFAWTTTLIAAVNVVFILILIAFFAAICIRQRCAKELLETKIPLNC